MTRAVMTAGRTRCQDSIWVGVVMAACFVLIYISVTKYCVRNAGFVAGNMHRMPIGLSICHKCDIII